jgi:hypothetical protein
MSLRRPYTREDARGRRQRLDARRCCARRRGGSAQDARAPRGQQIAGNEAWRIADALGWAKTYDAEYVATARLLGCRMVTLDARLRRGADRLGFVVTVDELA